MRRPVSGPGLAALLLVIAIPAQAGDGYRIETFAEDLQWPWCIAFLPDGDHLVTLRGGELLRLDAQGAVAARIANVPAAYVRSQGGLFDVLPDPDFTNNQRIYLSLAHGTASANGVRIVSARLEGDALMDIEVLFTSTPAKDTPVHYGGKLALLPDGTLLMTTGDGFDYREDAQKPRSLLGKTIRIARDGSIPGDNPFVDDDSTHDAIWTLGHRNPQGLAVTASGSVWQHEHGPRGGDELNLLRAGENYGWPVATFGIDYNGARISPFTAYPGMVQPVLEWTPSIAVSGLVWYDGDAFPDWRGDLFLGALAAGGLRHIQLDGEQVLGQHVAFPEISERVRDVRAGPDGFLYVLTDSESGRVLRVRP